MRNILSLSLLAAVVAPAVSAQVIVDEQFNYVDQTALAANWTLGTSGMTLNLTDGNLLPAVNFLGNTTSANIWRGTTFSIAPTDEAPLRLTADIYKPAATTSPSPTVTTVGLRNGTNPLFEMGFYRAFDNEQTGPDTTVAPPSSGTGIGVRTINIGVDLQPVPPQTGNQDWVRMDAYYTGWARFEATFTLNTVTTRIDLGADGTWEHSYTERGTSTIAPFTDLRIHAPAANAAGALPSMVDNVRLEIVPEPSSLALVGVGAALALARRRK